MLSSILSKQLDKSIEDHIEITFLLTDLVGIQDEKYIQFNPEWI